MLANRTLKTWCQDYSSLYIKKMQEKKKTPPQKGISFDAINSTFKVGN